MKKLLIITLFFCSFGYSSFEITELQCVGKNSFLGDIVYLRIDEKRQVLRVNLRPEIPIKVEDGKFEVEFFENVKVMGKDVEVRYRLFFSHMRLRIQQDKVAGGSYQCSAT